MPRRLPQRRRGKGTPTYKANSHRFKAEVCYKTYDEEEKTGVCYGRVIDIIHDPARTAPLMIVEYDYETVALPAPLGIAVGDVVEAGVNAQVANGNCLPLKAVPEGTFISNIELVPGDGGKIARSAGAKAKLVNKEGKYATIQLSSKKTKKIHIDCRCMIGVIAGGGHKTKPLVKAGNSYYKHKAKGKRWPHVRGCARNAIDHPHGGKQHRKRKSVTVSRHAPPGAKVGSIAARKTGRGKKRK